MDSIWKEKQLELLGSSDSIFKYIPDELGNILYCDTNNPKDIPLSPQEAHKRKTLGYSVSLLLLIGYWFFFYEHYMWGIILTLAVIIFAFGFCDTTFNGTDYFVGEQGFAVVNFIDSRTNITNKKIILFKDLSYLFTGETVNKMNYCYTDTDYYFALYKKLNSDGEHYDLAYNAIGSYSDKNPKDTMNPKGASEEYCMLKKIEQVWTSFFFESHKYDRELTFPMLKDNVIFSDALILNNNGVYVNGVRYNRENTKRIYFSNGQLVIEHQNHSKQFFGLVEHGNISGIPLSELGNRRAFLMLFDKIYKS